MTHADNAIREKENETPDLEDFGCSPTYTSSVSSDAHHLSPSKESPSRRKKLMGSLRSIGSLRGLRSSHLKDRGNERAEEPVEPEVSPSECIVESMLIHVCRVLAHPSVHLSGRERSGRHSHSTSNVLPRISLCLALSDASARHPAWWFIIPLRCPFLRQ